MNIVITDHAAARFAERVWPSWHNGPIKSREKIEGHLKTLFAEAKSIGKPYPIDLAPWAHLIKLGPGKFFRWHNERRCGMICKMDGDNRVILTCFSAILPGLNARETVDMLQHKTFYTILTAIDDVSPTMLFEDRVLLAKRLAEKLEGK